MIPLSFAQLQLWYLDRALGPNSVYHLHNAWRLRGTVDERALSQAFRDVVNRHESLRTTYPSAGGVPQQFIVDDPAAYSVLELVDGNSEDVTGLASLAAAQPFDLSTDLPIRAYLITVAPQEHILALVVHHIASDGWSIGPFIRDLNSAYVARLNGRPPAWEPLPVQYADFALWQRGRLGAEDDTGSMLTRQLEYWKATLAGLPEQLDLPYDRPRPPAASHRGGSVTFECSPVLHQGLMAFARDCQVTPFMVVQAALATLLTRLGAGHDIPIGVPVSGRADAALNDLVGCFVNTLVLRTDTAGDLTFRELLHRVREANTSAYANQDVPFQRIVEVLNPARSMARNPLFQIMLQFLINTESSLTLPGLQATDEGTSVPVALFDLTIRLQENQRPDGTPDGIEGAAEYATDLFDEATVRELSGRLVRVLEAVITAPDTRLSHIDILDPAERQRLLVRHNDTAGDIPSASIPRLVADQAELCPDATAVICDGRAVTYRQLNEQANQIAHHLMACGTGPEDLVALALPRDEMLVIAVLAVLKAGAGYLPIDAAYPAERIRYMIEDARPRLIISTTSQQLPVSGSPQLLLDHPETTAILRTRPVTDPGRSPEPHQTAYVIYTSGSTGVPKGVAIEHRSVSNFVSAVTQEHGAARFSRVLSSTSLNFDLSVLELFPALVHGGAIEIVRDILALAEPPHRDWRGSLLSTVPSAFSYLPESSALNASADAVVMLGEPLTTYVVGKIRTVFPESLLFNTYGPTEATVYATATRVSAGCAGAPPIGRPILNTQVYVLDATLRPVPTGVTGELHIAGAGLARGYLNKPSLTAERFTANPFGAAGSRMYRTGDLARWSRHGELEFMGRIDDQVKLHGFRVELGEIQVALDSHPQVSHSAVTVYDDDHGNRGQLIAYIVPASGPPPGTRELREHIRRKLPEYMVPSVYIPLAGLPLTPNGKLDRKALPAPSHAPTAAVDTPGGPLEDSLCHLFAELLDREGITADDNFFTLGGNSFVAIQLVTSVRSSMNVNLPLRAMFEAQTVRGLAQVISHLPAASSRPDDLPDRSD